MTNIVTSSYYSYPVVSVILM